MSTGFQFKQFYVRHDDCAMKVGTDSIMLGSWVMPGKVERILDIGSGSGVLSLMMAQKTDDKTKILGIDLDEKAVHQAQQNAVNSPWQDRVRFTLTDAADFQSELPFDLIISNPPYYVPKQGELSPGEAQYIEPKRRQARHTLSLSHQALLTTVRRNLGPQGRFCCVLPADYADALLEEAAVFDLKCIARTDVRATLRKPMIRSLLTLGFEGTTEPVEQLVIHGDDGGYSEAYRQLCRDFYLGF